MVPMARLGEFISLSEGVIGNEGKTSAKSILSANRRAGR